MKKPDNKKQNKADMEELKKIWRPDGENPTDVLGSYVGTQRDGDTPVQDADDL